MKPKTMALLSKVIRWSMEIFFIMGVATIILLPRILERYIRYLGNNQNFYNFILYMLIPCGLSALFILRQLISIFKSIDNSNPFIFKNVQRLRNISICCFIITAMFFVKCVFYPTFLTLIVALVFLIVAFCAIVFSALFGQAVEYKSENDLTI